jgi:hypothetical protein
MDSQRLMFKALLFHAISDVMDSAISASNYDFLMKHLHRIDSELQAYGALEDESSLDIVLRAINLDTVLDGQKIS